MSSIVNFLLSKLPLFKQLNGYKTIIAAALIVIPALLGMFSDLLSLFPDASIIHSIMSALDSVQSLLQRLADIVGVPLLALGVGHKAIKDNA